MEGTQDAARDQGTIDSVGETVDVTETDSGQSSSELSTSTTTNESTDAASAPSVEQDAQSDVSDTIKLLTDFRAMFAQQGGQDQSQRQHVETQARAAGKQQESQSDDDDDLGVYADVFKTAKETFGDDLSDKVLAPLTKKTIERVTEKLTKRFESKFEPVHKFMEQQKAAEHRRVQESARATIYATENQSIKAVIGSDYAKATSEQRKVADSILETATMLSFASMQMGKPIEDAEAIKRAVALASMEHGGKANATLHARNRARTVPPSGQRQTTPKSATVTGDPDTDSALKDLSAIRAKHGF